jgi:hypothetical protein
VRTVENHSLDWEKIEKAWKRGIQSNRAIAREFGISESYLRKRAKEYDWTRENPPESLPGTPRALTVRTDVAAGPSADQSSDEIKRAATVDPEELVRAGRDILIRLKDELDAITSHVGELEDMILEETADDKTSERRNAMLRAISFSTRMMAAKNYALAVKTLQDAAPGKKQQAQEAANNVGGADSKWGSDLDVGAAGRPN